MKSSKFDFTCFASSDKIKMQVLKGGIQMSQTDQMLETVIEQAKKIFPEIKDLRRIAGKKGEKRGKLIEKCTAIVHSFNVYTYASPTFQGSDEAQKFKETINSWMDEFKTARFDFDGDVNEEKVNELYDEVIESYNDMVETLGFEKEKLR